MQNLPPDFKDAMVRGTFWIDRIYLLHLVPDKAPHTTMEIRDFVLHTPLAEYGLPVPDREQQWPDAESPTSEVKANQEPHLAMLRLQVKKELAGKAYISGTKVLSLIDELLGATQ